MHTTNTYVHINKHKLIHANIHIDINLMCRKFDFDKMNIHGGSLAIGHPFGATGVRLMTTASNRLQREDKKYALLTACADGGLATACILERY